MGVNFHCWCPSGSSQIVSLYTDIFIYILYIYIFIYIYMCVYIVLHEKIYIYVYIYTYDVHLHTSHVNIMLPDHESLRPRWVLCDPKV